MKVFSIGLRSSEESEEKDWSKHKRSVELRLDKKIEGRKDIAWWVSRYFKLHSFNYMVETHIVMLWFYVIGRTRIHMFSLQKEIFPSKQYIKAAYREWSYEEQKEKLEGLDITKVSGCMLPREIFGSFLVHFVFKNFTLLENLREP